MRAPASRARAVALPTAKPRAVSTRGPSNAKRPATPTAERHARPAATPTTASASRRARPPVRPTAPPPASWCPPTLTARRSAKCAVWGSCRAEANLDCQIDCQADFFAECKVDLQGGCEADCSEAGAALFCDGQWVDHNNNLEACLDALRGILDGEVEGSASFECRPGECSGADGGSVLVQRRAGRSLAGCRGDAGAVRPGPRFLAAPPVVARSRLSTLVARLPSLWTTTSTSTLDRDPAASSVPGEAPRAGSMSAGSWGSPSLSRWERGQVSGSTSPPPAQMMTRRTKAGRERSHPRLQTMAPPQERPVLSRPRPRARPGRTDPAFRGSCSTFRLSTSRRSPECCVSMFPIRGAARHPHQR